VAGVAHIALAEGGGLIVALLRPSDQFGPTLRSLLRRKSASSLVLLEVATGFATISCVLLASGWYQRLANRPSGYDETDLIMIASQRPAVSDGGQAAGTAVDTDAAVDTRAALVRERAERANLAALPGVAALAPVAVGVLDQRWNFPVEVSWIGSNSARQPLVPSARAVGWTVYTSTAIAEVLRLHVIEGRFPSSTSDGAADVTVITRCLRDSLFSGPALGQTIYADDAPAARVVAVIDDVVLRDPWNASGACLSIRFNWPADERESRYLVRALPGQKAAVLGALRQALGPSGPARRVEVQPFDPKNAHPTRMARGLVASLAVMGGIVVLIALLGTLTVSSFLVRERMASIGIRRALGARPGDIVRLFLVETSILTFFGVVVGLIFTGIIFRLMERLYPGLVLSWRPVTLTGLLLWLGAMLGTLLPAHRAAQIPPSTAARGG
jgi:putative ABC transport system permease protein